MIFGGFEKPVKANSLIEEITPSPNQSLEAQATKLSDDAKALYINGDYASALLIFQQALEIYQAIDDYKGESSMLFYLGLQSYYLNNYKNALDYYEQGLSISKKEGFFEREANILNNIGEIYFKLSDYDKAIKYLNEAGNKFQFLGDLDGEADTKNNLGLSYTFLSNYEKGIDSFQQALLIRKKLNDKEGESAILNNLGLLYYFISDFENALNYFQQALIIKSELGNLREQSYALNNIGAIYINLADYEQAITIFEKSMKISRENNDQYNLAHSLNNLGLIYDELLLYNKSYLYYFEALNICQEYGYQAEEANLLFALGSFFIKQYKINKNQENFQKGLEYLQGAITVSHESGFQLVEAKVLSGFASAYEAIKDYEQALIYEQSSLDLSKEIGDIKGASDSLNNMGVYYEELDDYENALISYNVSLALSRQIGSPSNEALTLKNMGNLFEKKGDDPRALLYYIEAINIREKINSGMGVESLKSALASFNLEYYQFAIRLLSKLGRKEEAFNYSERNRARAFLDSMGNNQPKIKNATDAELLKLENTLEGEITALEASLQTEKTKQPNQQNIQIIESIKVQLTKKQKEFEDLLMQIELNNPELASFVSVPSTTVVEIQNLLDDQTTLVSYYLTFENALAFILSQESFQMIELPASSDEIMQTVANFQSMGLANLANNHPRSLADLHAMLVAPIEPYLLTSKVGIIPHQSLYYVPFAALSDGKQYFGEKYTLFYLPSASVLSYIQNKTGRRVANPLVMGNPQTDNADLSNLKYAGQEAQLVAELFNTHALMGADASETILQTKAGRAGVLHLAAHGSYNSVAPLFSRLWLAPGGDQDGKLNVYEIYNLDLEKTDLVVLSACQSQLGELSLGDDIVGMNRAFLYGAPTVMASLWSVDDKATSSLMKHFYTNILAGMGKASALKAAQNEVRTDPDNPNWAHPFFWAAFVLNGDPG